VIFGIAVPTIVMSSEVRQTVNRMDIMRSTSCRPVWYSSLMSLVESSPVVSTSSLASCSCGRYIFSPDSMSGILTPLELLPIPSFMTQIGMVTACIGVALYDWAERGFCRCRLDRVQDKFDRMIVLKHCSGPINIYAFGYCLF